MARKWNGKPIEYPKLRRFHEQLAELGFRSTDRGLAFVMIDNPKLKIEAELLKWEWLEGQRFCCREATYYG